MLTSSKGVVVWVVNHIKAVCITCMQGESGMFFCIGIGCVDNDTSSEMEVILRKGFANLDPSPEY